MFGKLLSIGIKTITAPVKMTNAALDIASGGDGSKASRRDVPNPLTLAEEIGDKAAQIAKDIDE